MMDDNYCFACGEDNPIGLKLKFTLNENKDKIRTEFVPGREFQGYPDITHGGIISTVLDECMARLTIDTGIDAVTAKMTTKFRKSAKTGERLVGEARFIKRGTSRKTPQCFHGFHFSNLQFVTGLYGL